MSYIEEAIKAGMQAGALTFMSAMPAIVKSFDAEAQTVEADIAIMRIVEGENKPYTLLVDIPILLPTVQGFHITLPIQPGDECLLIFADRCIDSWFTEGGIQPQQEHRVHHISDGFALIGVNSAKNVISDYSAEHLVIRNTTNSQSLTLKADGSIDITTDQPVSIKASSVLIDTPEATFTGKVSVAGEVTSAVSVTAPTLVGTSDVKAGGISGKTHTHGGIQPGSGTTSPPQ